MGITEQTTTRIRWSSKDYEKAEMYDMWEQLGLEEKRVSVDESKVEATIAAQDHVYTITQKPLTLKERVGILFGRQPEFIISDEWDTLVDTVGKKDLSEEERTAARRWLLANSHPNKAGKLPTPRQQMEEAGQLLLTFTRDHNADLIEAIKNLPKPEELLLRFPRELTQEERRQIKKIAKGIITKTPVSVRVSIP